MVDNLTYKPVSWIDEFRNFHLFVRQTMLYFYIKSIYFKYRHLSIIEARLLKIVRKHGINIGFVNEQLKIGIFQMSQFKGNNSYVEKNYDRSI